MKIDVVATAGPHMLDHTMPVYEALPEELRGNVVARARDLSKWLSTGPGMTLVANYRDLVRAREARPRRSIIYMEHGAGQTYRDASGEVKNPSYCGARDRRGVSLFLDVNRTVRENNSRAHPDVDFSIIGCPKLDTFSSSPGSAEGRTFVAVTFHWDCLVSPGTRSALPFYKDHLRYLSRALLVDGAILILHAHPRIAREVKEIADSIGAPFIIDIRTVVKNAAVLVGDTTSALYEFAAFDKPVVVMNQPEYFKEPDEGIRFWQHIPGIQVDEPVDLLPAIRTALEDPPEVAAARRAAVEHVYPFRGDATTRAVEAIRGHLLVGGGGE